MIKPITKFTQLVEAVINESPFANPEDKNEYEKNRKIKVRRMIVAAVKKGNWRPWIRNLLLHKSNPSKKWKVEITVDDVLRVWPKDNKCPIFGTLFEVNQEPRENNPKSPSIDRINPNLHYTPDNIRVISYRANRIKKHGSAQQFRAIAKWMRENNATPDLIQNEQI